jgi:hypothetical protein
MEELEPEETHESDKATKRPWFISVYAQGGFQVATARRAVDANLIRRAVNCHDELVAACEAVCADMKHESCMRCGHEISPGTYHLAETALAKAKGEA